MKEVYYLIDIALGILEQAIAVAILVTVFSIVNFRAG